MNALLTNERISFHRELLNSILTEDEKGIPSNADRSNKLSVRLAQGIRKRIIQEIQNAGALNETSQKALSGREKKKGQTSGSIFETLMMNFIERTFPKLQALRPGKWHILHLGNQSRIKTSDFSQYEHPAYLNELVKANAQLASSLGNDYLVAPDVIIYRELYNDDELNAAQCIVDDASAFRADLRKKKMAGNPYCMLHYPQNGRCGATGLRTAAQKP